MEPFDIGKIELLDALLYGVVVDTTRQSAVFTIEVEAAFHKGLTEYLPGAAGEVVMVDVVLTGVEIVQFSGLRPRPDEWDVDEKPHDYEIARVSIRKKKLRRDL